jgi:hypothetical protein
VIKVDVNPGGPLVLTTTAAMFEVAPTGYIQSYLLRDGKHLTLDEPKAGAPNESDYLVQNGKEVHFVLDFDQAKVLESIGKLGRGKHIEIPAHRLGPGDAKIQRTLTLEAYDDFPNLLLSTVEYKNTGNSDFTVDRAVEQRHRFTASLADPKAQPWEMWSFQGSSYEWGKDDVFKLTRTSAQPNLLGEAIKGGYGGGIPVVAFWTANVGEAIGHVETLPLTLSLPVKVAGDSHVEASLDMPAKTALKPGESFSTPRSFGAWRGLRAAADVVGRLTEEGWNLRSLGEAYNVS